MKVVDGSFEGPIATWVAKGRYWDSSFLPPEAVLDVDPRLRVVPIVTNVHRLQIPDPPPSFNGHQYSLTNNAPEKRIILARLGTNGPVLASTAVEGFRLFNCYDTYLRYVHIYPDGSQLVEEGLVLSPVLASISIEVRILVAGVTFEDGTVTKKLTASDFDELGVCRLRYVRSAGVKQSVCHVTKAYQGALLIGWPAYEK